MEDIDKHRAALAALIAARDACAEAGYSVDCVSLRYAEGHALDALVRDAEKRVASAERRALPIARGDEVAVHDVNSRHRPADRCTVTRVGRTLVYIASKYSREAAFRLDDGIENDNYGHRRISADDLARIKRDLVGKRAQKPAPVAVEIAVAKVQP
jgi:hypothetical protein